MTLLEIIRKKKLVTVTDVTVATATVATPATDKSVLASSVAKVASVAVANQETNKMVFSEKPSPIKAVTPVLEPSVATVTSVNVATETDGKPETLQDRQRETRRKKVIAMLEAAPGKERAIYADTDSDSHNVILTIAVRACQQTCEMLISKDKYDAFRLMELIERLGAQNVH